MKKLSPFLFAYCLFPTAYSFSQGVWTQKADFGGGGRYYATGFSIGTKGYIGTGLNTNGITNDFWEYDPSANSWTQKANFGGGARYLAVGFSICNKGYIGMGDTATTGNPFINDFWEWNQTTNVWTRKANFGGAGRTGAVGFSIGSNGYIGTGINTWPTLLQDFWKWDTTTNIWTQNANFGGTAREIAVGFSIGTKGYVGTGYDGAAQQDFWEWDQSADTWTQKADFGSAATGATGFSIGTKGYIGIGGANVFWEWDQASNTWTQETSFGGMIRGFAVGFSIGTKGYLGTGINPPNTPPFFDFWEFDPNATTVTEIDPENLISVYPNPTSGLANVIISQLANLKMKDVEIYNIRGEEIYQSANQPIGSSANFKIDLSSQPNGVYFIHLTTEQGNVTKRIILSH